MCSAVICCGTSDGKVTVTGGAVTEQKCCFNDLLLFQNESLQFPRLQICSFYGSNILMYFHHHSINCV